MLRVGSDILERESSWENFKNYSLNYYFLPRDWFQPSLLTLKLQMLLHGDKRGINNECEKGKITSYIQVFVPVCACGETQP